MTLQTAANIIILLTGTCATANLAIGWYHNAISSKHVGHYKAGDHLQNSKDLKLQTARQTILLVTQSRCHFCSESMPFYHTLVSTAHDHGSRVVAVAAEDVANNRGYLTSNGVIPDDVVSAKDAKIAVGGTPTVIVVQKNGRVVNSWLGKLSQSEQKAVLLAISKD